MPLPQFPNVFFGTADYQGEPAPVGMVVYAVIDSGGPQERVFSLPVYPKGRFGSPNGMKLKVGGSGPDIPHRARIAFYVVDGGEGTFFEGEEAGHSHFYADFDPHVTRLHLCQD